MSIARQGKLITPASPSSVPKANSVPFAFHAKAEIGVPPGRRASTSAPSVMRTRSTRPSSYPERVCSINDAVAQVSLPVFGEGGEKRRVG